MKFNIKSGFEALLLVDGCVSGAVTAARRRCILLFGPCILLLGPVETLSDKADVRPLARAVANGRRPNPLQF